MKRLLSLLAAISLLSFSAATAASWNGYSMKRYVAETPHFKIYYHDGIEHLVKPVGDKFEELYAIFQKTYEFKLPGKTEIVLQDGDESNGLTFPNLNFIILWTHDFDFDMRGSHDWFDDVITHEYAHLVSIWNAFKYPSWMMGIQFGYFTHPNEPRRTELFQMLPSDILPPWFTEGIAQYESSSHGSDSWDTHRDMILRSLTLSGKLLTWDHMQVFAGKGDDFEKTYDHGFSLVTYIAEKYGHDRILTLCRKSTGVTRLNFDGVLKDVLGISKDKLYSDWKKSLLERYKRQLDSIGKPVTGRKINKTGFSNSCPRFSPDGRKIYFLSNGKRDYGFKQLYSYVMADSVKDDKKIKLEMDITGFYDINARSRRISFSSQKSKKSELPPSRGGIPSMDLFTDTLPPEKETFKLFPKKTEKQVTIRQGIFSAAFSPTGDKLVVAQRHYDRFTLGIIDTSGKNFRTIYPNLDSVSRNIHFIYSVAWSSDGKTLAFSYFDKNSRKIGLYDTATRAVSQLENKNCDQRDPSFSPDGSELYFSSDESGIFNIYRYSFATGQVSRVTNVVGGAFAPALSPDGRKLAYAGYDSSGYGIYLIDTLKPMADSTGTPKFSSNLGYLPRAPLPRVPGLDLTSPSHLPSSKIPRQFMLVPTIMAEQLNTKDNNVYSGASAFKAGAVAYLSDIYSWLNMGTQLGGLFLLEPHKIHKFINLDDGGVDIGSSYDVALFGSTQIFPLTLSADYYLRGIAGRDFFFDETEGVNTLLPYNIQIQNLNVLLTHYFTGEMNATGGPKNAWTIDLLGGLNRYDVTMKLDNTMAFTYNVGKEFRAGAMTTFGTQVMNSRSSISPRGLATKLQYNYWRLFSLKEENSFTYSNGFLRENLDHFGYHEAILRIMAGKKMPLFGDLHFDFKGDVIKVAHQNTVFPSFYKPLAWVPGYIYYDTITRHRPSESNPDAKIKGDTVIVTGNAVVNGTLSYRFPLSRPLIDKKLWIFYLEKIDGCLNMNYGIGIDRPSRLLEWNRNDWLLSFGPELRLQASTFGGIPLAVKLRWDRGVDRPAPVGGDRISLAIGFDFDDWRLVSLPDYRTPGI